MISKQFVILAVSCGIFMHTVVCQMDVLNSFSTNVAGVDNQVVQTHEDSGTVDPDEDDDGDDVMTRVGEVESIEEFMALLTRNGHPVTPEDIYDENVDEDGKVVISGGGRLAVPDNCSPRNTTVRITMEEDTDSDVAFFPRCTKIERCGGCCSSPNLECVPSYTERVVLKVLKGRVPYPGAPHLEYTGFASLIEERHMTCRVTCKLNAESCGPKKNFSRRKCNCKCRRVLACTPPTVWDRDDCECKCPVVQQCCSIPNCGMVWSPTSCQCVLSNDGRIVIAADPNNQGHASGTSGNHGAQHVQQQTTPTTTPTTTTTTTSATTTPVDPCSNMSCPPRFTRVRNGNICQCRPRFNNRRWGRGRG